MPCGHFTKPEGYILEKLRRGRNTISQLQIHYSASISPQTGDIKHKSISYECPVNFQHPWKPQIAEWSEFSDIRNFQPKTFGRLNLEIFTR